MNIPEQMRLDLARKLSPDTVYLPTSARLLIDYLVSEPTTDVYYKEINCCRDTTLTVVESDHETAAPIPASRETLVFYVLALAHVVDLTPRERSYLLSRDRCFLPFWRRLGWMNDRYIASIELIAG
jgi:hypothetical protein